jgi:hypothetical protein
MSNLSFIVGKNMISTTFSRKKKTWKQKCNKYNNLLSLKGVQISKRKDIGKFNISEQTRGNTLETKI